MRPEPSRDTGDFVLVNARLAENGSAPRGQGPGQPTAVVVRRGRIAYVGDDDTARASLGHGGKVVDLHGSVVVAGLVDAHIHAFDCALDSLHVSCLPPAVDSMAALQRRLADRAAANPPGSWVIGTGYDDTRLRSTGTPCGWT